MPSDAPCGDDLQSMDAVLAATVTVAVGDCGEPLPLSTVALYVHTAASDVLALAGTVSSCLLVVDGTKFGLQPAPVAVHAKDVSGAPPAQVTFNWEIAPPALPIDWDAGAIAQPCGTPVVENHVTLNAGDGEPAPDVFEPVTV